MTGNIWMCSHLLDAEDLDFGKHEFITYKIRYDHKLSINAASIMYTLFIVNFI